jgi:hypothetical protein
MDFKTVSKNLLFAIAGGAFAFSAFAQWQWVDKDGRKVFSDRSPPPEINEKDILKRPSGSIRSSIATAPSGPAAVSTASKPVNTASAAIAKDNAPRLTGKDAELEAKKKQTEDQEAAQKKAEEEKVNKAKAENCERAKRAVAGLDSGLRISTTNAKGDREFMDDKTRAAETKRLKDTVASDCK